MTIVRMARLLARKLSRLELLELRLMLDRESMGPLAEEVARRAAELEPRQTCLTAMDSSYE